MKLRDLIERLEELEADLIEALGDDCEPEVLCAIQPQYPLAVRISGATVLDEDDEPQLLDGQPIVWIATSGHPHGVSPYAPGAVWEAL
ncbi:MAG: hypothetical protein JNL28_03630 [Planctomycetes bacterium]|nr:hypothetical protein [Planctomycetota bacterium]